ncbi:hypothetical protein EDB81DRAFT_875739 [Dactylonectria macrodidyma]|uniref:Uncharacterized protein n=1 Tax=Dactylonectria macrodidyma TaxID=307937 RepID=A0A9P9JP99_9HYPO|nr:hypothetical protein EDB81DRAFT_875739 [Dactylonectria macrodidyma]
MARHSSSVLWRAAPRCPSIILAVVVFWSINLDLFVHPHSLATDEECFEESKQTELSLVAWIFMGLAILTALTKLYTTLIIFRRPRWNDLMISSSLLCRIVASSFCPVFV